MIDREMYPKTLNNFLDYMKKNKNKSDKTIESYGSDLHMLIGFLKLTKNKKNIDAKTQLTKIDIHNTGEKFFQQITFKDINDFIEYLDLRGNSPASKNRRISAMQAFYNYLCKYKIVKENIAQDLEKVEVPDRERAYLKIDEMNKVLDTMKQENHRFIERDSCLMIVLMNTGLRNSELRNIKITDINWETRILKVIGKRNKERKVPLNDTVIESIKVWMQYREDINIKNGYEDYLFLSQQGNTLSSNMLNKIVKDYIDRAGFDISELHTHSLRHSALSAMIKKTKDLATVQKISGHKNIQTLANIYIHIDDEDIQEAVKNLGIG